MKSIIIGGTVIANKSSAINFITRINNLIPLDGYEAAAVLTDYEERLVNAGFVTWEEVELCC